MANPTAKTFNNPYSVYSDGTKLFVADYTNNRVLIYNTIPIANDTSANVVVGQTAFTTKTANQGGVGANTLLGCRRMFPQKV